MLRLDRASSLGGAVCSESWSPASVTYETDAGGLVRAEGTRCPDGPYRIDIPVYPTAEDAVARDGRAHRDAELLAAGGRRVRDRPARPHTIIRSGLFLFAANEAGDVLAVAQGDQRGAAEGEGDQRAGGRVAERRTAAANDQTPSSDPSDDSRVAAKTTT